MKKNSYILFTVLLLVLCFQSMAGPKIDTLYFQSGDRITGEFKGLENNLVKFSTSDASTIEVKWDRIDSLYIKHYLRIELTDGEILYGTMKPTDSLGIDAVFGNYGVRIVDHADVIRIANFNDKLLDRLDGSLSAGLNYNKSTDIFQYDFAGSIQYTGERYIVESNYSSMYQKQNDADASQRHNFNLKTIRLLENKWFYSGNISTEKNSELGLDLRANIGASFGNNLIFTNYSLFYLSAGAQLNREQAVDSLSYNAEGVLSARLSIFKYRYPKLSLSINADTYPSLTTWGRIRFQTDSNVRWEVLSRLYLKVTLFYTYDNQPLSETASKSDFGTTLGVEFTF